MKYYTFFINLYINFIHKKFLILNKFFTYLKKKFWIYYLNNYQNHYLKKFYYIFWISLEGLLFKVMIYDKGDLYFLLTRQFNFLTSFLI